MNTIISICDLVFTQGNLHPGIKSRFFRECYLIAQCINGGSIVNTKGRVYVIAHRQ